MAWPFTSAWCLPQLTIMSHQPPPGAPPGGHPPPPGSAAYYGTNTVIYPYHGVPGYGAQHSSALSAAPPGTAPSGYYVLPPQQPTYSGYSADSMGYMYRQLPVMLLPHGYAPQPQSHSMHQYAAMSGQHYAMYGMQPHGALGAPPAEVRAAERPPPNAPGPAQPPCSAAAHSAASAGRRPLWRLVPPYHGDPQRMANPFERGDAARGVGGVGASGSGQVPSNASTTSTALHELADASAGREGHVMRGCAEGKGGGDSAGSSALAAMQAEKYEEPAKASADPAQYRGSSNPRDQLLPEEFANLAAVEAVADAVRPPRT